MSKGSDEAEQVRVERPAEGGTETIVSGHGGSPGVASGPARIVAMLDELDKVREGDIIVTEMTTPDMVPAMKRADGIVTDEGGMTSHAAIVSRELGVPAVVGAGHATRRLQEGQAITLDGERGTVSSATGETPDSPGPTDDRLHRTAQQITATGVRVNVSLPEAAQRAAATGADGVGLLRLEHVLLSTNKTPARYVADHGEEAYVEEIAGGVRTVAEAFYPRSVRVRTLDAPTDELAELAGGAMEPDEHNPMLGYRGVRRSLAESDLCKLELRAFERLYAKGYDNLEVMFPMANDASELRSARQLLVDVGIDLDEHLWGAMVETPASVRNIDDLIGCGIDFVAFGTNDLVQFILAVDRNNGTIADRFDELHPSVLEAMEETIDSCRAHDVQTSVVGQAASHPEMVRFLVERGITSISANIDAVADVRREVGCAEQRAILDAARF